MPEERSNQPLAAIRRQVLDTLRAIDLLARGTLLKRTKVCGKKGCRCAQDPAARHGPYYEWGRMEKYRLVHTMVSPAEARLVVEAIRNYRRIQRLLRTWERETAKMILEEKRRNR